MNCRRIEPLLSRHLDGSLSKPDAETVLVHVADCPACRRLRDQFLAIGQRLREPVAAHLVTDVDQCAIEQWLAERASAPPNVRDNSDGDARSMNSELSTPMLSSMLAGGEKAPT